LLRLPAKGFKLLFAFFPALYRLFSVSGGAPLPAPGWGNRPCVLQPMGGQAGELAGRQEGHGDEVAAGVVARQLPAGLSKKKALQPPAGLGRAAVAGGA
jgi:hypothetical protein